MQFIIFLLERYGLKRIVKSQNRYENKLILKKFTITKKNINPPYLKKINPIIN